MPTKIVNDEERLDRWPSMRGCRNPQHDPPSMIVIPAGHHLEHECPGCGFKTTLRPLVARF